MQQGRKFAFDVSWVLLSSAINLVFGFVLKILLARWLGSFDLGLYSLVLTVQELGALVAGIGISSALTKFVAEHQDNKDRFSQIVFTSLIMTVFFAILATILLYFLAPVVASFFKMPQLAHLLKILAFSFPFMMINQSTLGLENGLRRMKYYSAQLIMRSFLMFALIVALTWAGFGVEGTVYGLVFAWVATSIWGVYLARGFIHIASGDFQKNTRTLLSFGVQVFGTSSVSTLMTYADTIMVGYFLTATDVGYYNVALSMVMLFTVFPQAVQLNTYPMTAHFWYSKNFEALREMIDKSMKYSAVIMLPFGLFFAFFAKEITTVVFGAEYLSSVTPFLILLLAGVMRSATVTPVGASFTAIGRPDIGLKVSTLLLILYIPLNWFLIPRYGITGAAMASTTIFMIGTFISIGLLPMLRFKFDFKWYGTAIGFAGMSYAIYWGLSKFINQYIVGVIVLIAYIYLIIKVFLTREDRTFIASLVKSVLTRRKK
jgi:stage V sporulation protein B